MNKTSDEDEIEKLVAVLKDKDALELVGNLHKTLYPYYDHYSDTNGLMEFKSFFNFAKDFGIFPDYLSKAKLYKFFNILSDFYKKNSKKKFHPSASKTYEEEHSFIDEHLFTELLVLCSLEVYNIDPQPTPIEDGNIFNDKISQSEAQTIFEMQKGGKGTGKDDWNDFFLLLKLNYPYFYELTSKQKAPEGRRSERVKTRKPKKEIKDPLAELFK